MCLKIALIFIILDISQNWICVSEEKKTYMNEIYCCFAFWLKTWHYIFWTVHGVWLLYQGVCKIFLPFHACLHFYIFFFCLQEQFYILKRIWSKFFKSFLNTIKVFYYVSRNFLNYFYFVYNYFFARFISFPMGQCVEIYYYLCFLDVNMFFCKFTIFFKMQYEIYSLLCY